MASAKDSFTNAVPVLAAGAAGAVAGHFVGKGKNLLLGAALVLGADMIAGAIPVKAINATNLRTAGAVALLVNPAAASGSNQSLADFAKDGVNRIKGAINATAMGAGMAQGPFTLSSALPAIPMAAVEGVDYIGETPYTYGGGRYIDNSAAYYPQQMLTQRSVAGR